LDDEADHRVEVASLLREAGCEIVAMCDSEFAAAAWLKCNPGSWELGVIDVDLALEQGSGMNAALRFVNAPGQGSVVIYTTYVSESVRETGRLLGASATISKRDPEELHRFVRALIRS
jgi:DNA-binding NarL/FixJ family response regulator